VQGAVTDTLGATFSFSHEGHDGIKERKQTVYKNYVHSQLKLDASDNFTLRGGAELTAYEADGKDWVSWTSTWEDDTADELLPRFWLVGDYAFNVDHSLKLQGYFQRIDGDIVAAASTGAQDYDNSYGDAEIQYTGRFFDDHLFTSGIEYLRSSYKGNFVADSANTTISAYAQDEWQLFDGSLILIPGVRVDDNSDYGRQWSPKFNAMYTPLPGTRLRAGLGKTFKAPTPGQMSSERFWMVYMWAEGNPDLQPEEGFTWQVGVEQDALNNRLGLGVTYYNTRLTDMITEGLREDGVYSYSNVAEGEIQGIEATANLELMTSLHLILTYAYTDATDGQTGERLSNVPEHAFGAQLDYTNEKFGFGGMLSLSHTTDQINGMSVGTTEDFTTVGCNVRKDIMANGRIVLDVINLFDEELRGSELFYPRQTIKAGIEFDF
jgi:outer membrane receptor for ferrienterochelin and colicins